MHIIREYGINVFAINVEIKRNMYINVKQRIISSLLENMKSINVEYNEMSVEK